MIEKNSIGLIKIGSIASGMWAADLILKTEVEDDIKNNLFGEIYDTHCEKCYRRTKYCEGRCTYYYSKRFAMLIRL